MNIFMFVPCIFSTCINADVCLICSIAVISVELGSKVGVQLLRRSFLQHFLLAAKWTGDVCRRGVQHDGVYCMRLVVVVLYLHGTDDQEQQNIKLSSCSGTLFS